MSEQVEVERSEAVLFLLERDSRRDAWSFFGERFRLCALPRGSGGREDVGELENTSIPWEPQPRPLCVGMGMLGDTEGTRLRDETVEQPLGMSTTSETSSSEHEASVGGRVRCRYYKKFILVIKKAAFQDFILSVFATVARARTFSGLQISAAARTSAHLEEPQPRHRTCGSIGSARIDALRKIPCGRCRSQTAASAAELHNSD